MVAIVANLVNWLGYDLPSLRAAHWPALLDGYRLPLNYGIRLIVSCNVLGERVALLVDGVDVGLFHRDTNGLWRALAHYDTGENLAVAHRDT